jgi:hypothetical protein
MARSARRQAFSMGMGYFDPMPPHNDAVGPGFTCSHLQSLRMFGPVLCGHRSAVQVTGRGSTVRILAVRTGC